MFPNIPEDGVWSAEGLPVFIYVKDEAIMGVFGKRINDILRLYWVGENCALESLFSDLLDSIAFLLSKGERKDLIDHDNKALIQSEVREHNFNVKNLDLAKFCGLGAMYSTYIFELDDEKDELIIHYYNFKAKKSGEVRVPFKPFIKEIFDKYIDEFLDLAKISYDKESYDFLINQIKSVMSLYKERYGEELNFKITE